MMTGERSEDFIDLYELASTLWARKYWILTGTLAGMVGGGLYSAVTAPTYQARAVISSNAPRSAFSEMMVGLPLSGGGASILEVRLTSRSISEKVAELEPGVARKLFPDRWDEKAEKWSSGVAPSKEIIGGRLRKKHLEVTSNARSGVVNINIVLPDSAYARHIADAYLRALKISIQDNVTKELEESQRFLDDQMQQTTDPVLLVTIQEVKARNVQRATFNNPADFQVIEYPSYPTGKSGPQIKRSILLWGIIMGAAMAVGVFLQYMALAMIAERRQRVDRESRH